MLSLTSVFEARNTCNIVPIVSYINEDETGHMLESFIFDSDSLDPEQENEKHVKWNNLSNKAQETIKLLIEMPDYVKRIVVTPSGHLIRVDANIRFFLLVCAIIGFEDARAVFDEINIFMKDFHSNDIPDFRLQEKGEK